MGQLQVTNYKLQTTVVIKYTWYHKDSVYATPVLSNASFFVHKLIATYNFHCSIYQLRYVCLPVEVERAWLAGFEDWIEIALYSFILWSEVMCCRKDHGSSSFIPQ